MGLEITPPPPFVQGKSVPLEAKTSSTVSSWKWASSADKGKTFIDIAGANASTFELDMAKRSGETLRVTAQLQDGTTESATVVATPAQEPETKPGSGGAGEPPEPPSIWYTTFAVSSGVVAALIILLLFLVTDLGSERLGLDDTFYAKLDGRALVGAAVIGPITLVGVVVTVIGVWMVAVEWRGRFVKTPADVVNKGLDDVVQVLTALGKLRGSTLVLVSGVAILLGVAFMTSSTVGATPASPSSPTSTDPASSTSTTPPTDSPAETSEPTPTG